ncbi:hypothetical protein OOT46_14875 [Aquabacterium sp. A7-Y]|uniref:calcium-binding protein n=1 Tax=Aquabacterium sp. A7-Y TaxID=1349605 RepID=UPI00223D6EFC|nr:calcium-binding protein [Aquabacterium sp. A7-Y]MCW7539125.1 hypothetical protein [Aquabacterium sp. A7-Y]
MEIQIMAIINGTFASDFLKDLSEDLVSTLNANWSLGDDEMAGGVRDDTYCVNSLGDDVIESSGQGTDTVVSRLYLYTIANNVENLVLDNTATQLVSAPGGYKMVAAAVNGQGNQLDNLMQGNDRDNSLGGGAGADKLYGGAGIDTLDGGLDNDYLDGGAGDDMLNDSGGDDTMVGGTGNDTYYLDSAGDHIVEYAALGGQDQVYASVNYTLEAQVENLTLLDVEAATEARGNALANTIKGNTRDNTLSGLDGADTLDGGDGNDTLFGGKGVDLLNGQAGADLFVFGEVGPAHADLIKQFQDGLDRIGLADALDQSLPGSPQDGVLGLKFLGDEGVGAVLDAGYFFKGSGSVGNLSGQHCGIYVNTQDGRVWYNPTTALGGDTQQLCQLNPADAARLDASDFIYGG